jgi:hypothetical protein
MGLFLISVAAMTSFFTMLQLSVLALTLSPSPPLQASGGPQGAGSVSVESHAKKNKKVASRRSAAKRTRRMPKSSPTLPALVSPSQASARRMGDGV